MSVLADAVFTGDLSLVIVILGVSSRLLTTSATHVRELEESVKVAPRQLSSPDPVDEVSVMWTFGTGNSRGEMENTSNMYTHVHINTLTLHSNSCECARKCSYNELFLLLWTDSYTTCIHPLVLGTKWTECQVVSVNMVHSLRTLRYCVSCHYCSCIVQPLTGDIDGSVHTVVYSHNT